MYKKLTFCSAIFPPSDGNLCLVKNINEDTNMILPTERKRHGKTTNSSAIITYIYWTVYCMYGYKYICM